MMSNFIIFEQELKIWWRGGEGGEVLGLADLEIMRHRVNLEIWDFQMS